MAWVTIEGSDDIWEYEDTATATNTYADANGTYEGGIRTFNPPGATLDQDTYVRCRMVDDEDEIERGELSKNYYDAQSE